MYSKLERAVSDRIYALESLQKTQADTLAVRSQLAITLQDQVRDLQERINSLELANSLLRAQLDGEKGESKEVVVEWAVNMLKGKRQ